MTTTSNADGWSTSGNLDWNNDGGVRLGYGMWSAATGATTLTKTFHMPANTSVKMYVRGKVVSTAGYTNTFTASVSGTSVAEASVKGGNSSSFELTDKVGTMTSSDPTISIRNASATATRASYVYELELQYNL
ncbi:MAG: hypothetical protein IKA49_01360 [Alistipes sp.]|nr:hypothetical protein [Alistipes sp.]